MKSDYYRECAFPKPGSKSSSRRLELEQEKKDMTEYRRKHPKCEECGSGRVVSVHHRQPKKMGGTRSKFIHSEANWISLCIKCHGAKHGVKVQ